MLFLRCVPLTRFLLVRCPQATPLRGRAFNPSATLYLHSHPPFPFTVRCIDRSRSSQMNVNRPKSIQTSLESKELTIFSLRSLIFTLLPSFCIDVDLFLSQHQVRGIQLAQTLAQSHGHSRSVTPFTLVKRASLVHGSFFRLRIIVSA